MPFSAARPRTIAKIIGPGTDNLSLGLELDLTPNYLLYAKPYCDNRVIKDHIGFARLPESCDRSYPGDIQMTKINPGLRSPSERIITFQVDESQGLMAVLTIQESTDQVKVRYLTFETNSRRHPLSIVSKSIIPFQGRLYSYQLQIYGELVGVLLSGKNMSCLHIIGWVNGTLYGHLAQNSSAGAMSSFSFLTRNKILTTNTSSSCIDFWYFHPGVLQATATITMPSTAPGVAVESFICTPLTGEQLKMWQGWNNLFVTFALTMLIDEDAYTVVNFVLQKERLDQLSNYGPLAWCQWGGERVACFDETDAKDNCNLAGSRHISIGLSHALGKPNTITIHEFNPPSNSIQAFHVSVDGVSPFTEQLIQNLNSYMIYQGQLHCDRALVPDSRIFAIHDSPNNTIIILYHL
ncbi:hypothetical protein BDZ94DRAFT_1261251 [Collybia nuda]|uniref:Uncharacterized protein n=1 Tax=Collybia nuda TaxID=64659 RepID=A0A9P5Y325_9AGAR|nr:hypothetical protein BDZ94DRAFT_1261251 [Collybia nuda]